MRALSVTQIKRRLRGKKVELLPMEPREGSRLRELYDLLMGNAGKPVPLRVSQYAGRGANLTQLRDTYGLDIRMVRQGHTSALIDRKSVYVLAGEWFGDIYVDYTTSSEEQMDLLLDARYALQNAEHPENILPDGVRRLSANDMIVLERIAEKGRKIAEKHAKRGS